MTKTPPKYDKRANVDPRSLTIENVIRDISSPAVVETAHATGCCELCECDVCELEAWIVFSDD
jgi:hypothetical protein